MKSIIGRKGVHFPPRRWGRRLATLAVNETASPVTMNSTTADVVSTEPSPPLSGVGDTKSRSGLLSDTRRRRRHISCCRNNWPDRWCHHQSTLQWKRTEEVRAEASTPSQELYMLATAMRGGMCRVHRSVQHPRPAGVHASDEERLYQNPGRMARKGLAWGDLATHQRGNA